MIYQEPELTDADRHVLNLIKEQREKLSIYTNHNLRRWFGTLRKATLARAIRGSISIEGYDATLDEAMAAVEEDDPPLDERTETWLAINSYRLAMTYILQTYQDSTFEFGKQFLKSLHFMMLQWDMSKSPGQWRSREIYVVDDRLPDPVYEAPDHEEVDALIDELVEYIREGTSTSILIKAAMAHLNLTMIHPFRDGNGRMARALQTLVLSQDGLNHPIFSSIEEWLGRNTPEYYKALEKMSNGKWAPEYDASSWIRFCLTAHYQQALTIIRRHEEYDALFERIERVISDNQLHERTTIPLFDCALGMRMNNSKYQREADVSVHVATRDLKQLVEADLLQPYGEKRGRHYYGSEKLRDHRANTRVKKPVPNPYEAYETSDPLPLEEPPLPGF
ncbi:MAG: Fic family protein [Pseudomonadota bacterium]